MLPAAKQFDGQATIDGSKASGSCKDRGSVPWCARCLRSCRLRTCSQFVVSIMSEWFIESANHTCGNFPPEVDEMALAGLTREKSTIVSPPRVKESAVNMECEVRTRCCVVALAPRAPANVVQSLVQKLTAVAHTELLY